MQREEVQLWLLLRFGLLLGHFLFGLFLVLGELKAETEVLGFSGFGSVSPPKWFKRSGCRGS